MTPGAKVHWHRVIITALLCPYMASSIAALPPSGISVTRWPIFRHPLAAYACALGLTAIAFLVRWNLDFILGNSAKLIFFMFAAALSAFLFGRGPGIASTI